MQALWHRYGRDFYDGKDSRHYRYGSGSKIIEEISGLELQEFFRKYIYGTVEIPLAELFSPFGISMNDANIDVKPGLDIRVKRSGSDCVVTHVFEGGAAHRAGISAGDVLLAIEGLRVSSETLR